MSRPNETEYGKGPFDRTSDFHKFQDGYSKIDYHNPIFEVDNENNEEGMEVGWYFWDETWTNIHGPFNTRQKVRNELKKYSEELK